MVELTDGHYLSQCIVLPTFPLIREWGIQVLLRGHAGELMHFNKAYNFSLDQSVFQIRQQKELEAWLLKQLSAYMLEAVDGQLLVQADTGQRESLVRESIQEALSETSAWETPVNRISHLFLTQRLRRETALSLMKFQSVTEDAFAVYGFAADRTALVLPARIADGGNIASGDSSPADSRVSGAGQFQYRSARGGSQTGSPDGPVPHESLGQTGVQRAPAL